jgi:uncharacterized membrane protein YgcG
LGKTLLPFLLMALSVLIFFVSRKKVISLYYQDVLQIIETLSLIAFYAAGNYFVVREANAMLQNQSPSVEIPFSILFWILTFIVPFFYMYLGISNKDRKSLLLGGLALGASIFTYRYYHAVLPLEWALAFGGLALIVFSSIAIKYFKTPKYNLCSAPSDRENYQKLEGILTSSVLQAPGQQGNDLKFGGGEFGGGGGEQSY